LSELEDAWLPMLRPLPWARAQADGFRLRGRILFGVGARLLGAHPTDAESPGELWSLADGAHHCSDTRSRDFLLSTARQVELPNKAEPELRALTILAALASADVRGRGPLGRGIAALSHRLTGRFRR